MDLFFNKHVVKSKNKKPKQKITLKEIYKNFKKENKDIKTNAQDFRNICEDFNYMLMQMCIYESYEFDFPGRLGKFKIKKEKTKLHNLKTDFANTKKYGKPIKHLNEHSGGYHYKSYWKKGRHIHISLYRFDLTRANKREITEASHKNTIKAL